MAKSKVSPKDYSVLQQLGFNKTEILCYENLVEHGGCLVAILADRLNLTPQNLYRALKHLEKIGFVVVVKADGPAYFHAVSIEKAMDNFFRYQLRVVNPLSGPLVYRP